MTKERSSRPFAALATKYKRKYFSDEFFVARLKLSGWYALATAVVLGIFSLLVYYKLNQGLVQTVHESVQDRTLARFIIDHNQDVLQSRILFVLGLILFFIVAVSFFLTRRTLSPIKRSVEKNKRFIANASHELRTPLAIMKTSLEVALNKKELTSEQAKAVLRETLGETDTLIMLANDLLTLAKGEVYSSKSEKIDINALVRQILVRLEPERIVRGVSVDYKAEEHSPFVLQGNSLLVGQALYNIVYNALIHTPKGGSVRIDLARHGSSCRITVSDTGIGIAREHLARIFDPFYQADNSRSKEGTGLGLSIAKQTIEEHGGRIEIESAVGQGTSVRIYLPEQSS